MRRLPLLLLAVACAAADAAAQATPSTRRPPRDTIRVGRPAADSIRMAEEGDVVSIDALEEEPEADTVPRPGPGPYARANGTGPFTVQASGAPAPRPARGEVVWVNTAPARRDTAAVPAPRVASGQSGRRDTASATRPAPRDSARAGTGQRVTSGQTARRDTAASTRPQNRPAPHDTAGGRTQAGGRTGTAAPAGGRTGGTPAPAARGRTHTVAAGETFYGIARRYGVTAAQLRALNPDVDMNALEVGDVLRLPAGARDSRPAAPPRAGTGEQGRTGGAQTPPRGSRTHTVAAGETLFGIARRYGVTVAAIRQANGMETDQVQAGQRLVIPPAR